MYSHQNSRPRQWLRLSTKAHAEAVEAISELFRRHIPGGVCIEEALEPNGDAEGWRIDLSQPVVVSAYVPLDERAASTQQVVEEGLWHVGQILPVLSFDTSVVSEEDWSQAWKEHYHVHRVGRRLVIKPSWREYRSEECDLVIELDPGLAFGTGLHPTTQMCLCELEQRVSLGITVADVGTGSGILAIAAALLGARHVFGCDTDPLAVDAAQQNVCRNGLGERIQVELGTLGRASDAVIKPPSFDLVVTNIVADVIVGLMPHLFAATAPGGVVVLSGIIREKEARVKSSMEELGYHPLGRRQQGDWVLLIGRRAASD